MVLRRFCCKQKEELVDMSSETFESKASKAGLSRFGRDSQGRDLLSVHMPRELVPSTL